MEDREAEMVLVLLAVGMVAGLVPGLGLVPAVLVVVAAQVVAALALARADAAKK